MNFTNKNKIDLSFIIINYNLAKEIEDCLNSLMLIVDSLKDFRCEIIIVDNNSPDKKLPETEKKFNRDNNKFYYLDENVGFGKGCNFGFSKASGEYICFLNPDTIIKENIFLPIIDLFKNNKSIGIIGPKQQVRPPFFDFSAGFYPNILFELFNLFGVGVFFEGFIVFILTKINKNKILKVDWILGASIFIKSEMFAAVDGFDKDYFMFFEEVDLCKRISDKGFKIVYCPQYSIHHIGSVSGKKDYTLYTIRTYSSKYLYISKHYAYLYKLLMKSLLYLQSFSQMIIWTILYPANKQKSKQKLNAFIYLIKHKMRLN
jgi:GT2 family glycosyltransferase